MAIAHAALAAGELKEAREAAEAVLRTAPRESAYLLLADIEEAQTGDQGRVRQWLSRAVKAPRDPAWTADGYVSERWAPASPVTGRLNAFEWKVPVEQLGPVIDSGDDFDRALATEPVRPREECEAAYPGQVSQFWRPKSQFPWRIATMRISWMPKSCNSKPLQRLEEQVGLEADKKGQSGENCFGFACISGKTNEIQGEGRGMSYSLCQMTRALGPKMERSDRTRSSGFSNHRNVKALSSLRQDVQWLDVYEHAIWVDPCHP